MSDWIPYSRPNWLPQDVRAAQREYCDYPDPATGSKAVDELRERLAEFWAVPSSWILLTSSCTEAIGLWADYRLRAQPVDCEPMTAVPGLTWPGSYCAIRTEKVFEDIEHDCIPIHQNKYHTGLRVSVRLYGLSPGVPDRNQLIDAAHDVGFPPQPYLNCNTYGAVAYSFGPVKQLSSLGGGALVSPLCADRTLQQMASSGVDSFRVPQMDTARKCRMLPSSAACILSQLERYDEDQDRRMAVVDWYCKNIPKTIRLYMTSGHLGVLRFPGRRSMREFKDWLWANKVRTGHHYSVPQTQAARRTNAREFARNICTVPLFSRFKGRGEKDRLKGVILQGLEAAAHALDRGE
jgi:dTDP-4-amino-4,6-dideoxygalactose transaminase